MMCEHIHILSYIENFRWIGICEHDKIHLSWDHLILFLNPNELNKLGMVLDIAITENERFKQHRYALEHEEMHWSVPEQGHFDVWIGRYALRLSPVDYLLFGSMVSKALSDFPLQMGVSPIAMRVEEKIERGVALSVKPDIQFSMN